MQVEFLNLDTIKLKAENTLEVFFLNNFGNDGKELHAYHTDIVSNDPPKTTSSLEIESYRDPVKTKE